MEAILTLKEKKPSANNLRVVYSSLREILRKNEVEHKILKNEVLVDTVLLDPKLSGSLSSEDIEIIQESGSNKIINYQLKIKNQ